MKKLAIVGAEPRTRENAPFDDPEYDIWAISNWAKAEWMKRVSAVIEIHIPSIYTNHPKDSSYWHWLRETETPVFMYPPDSRVKSAVEYPLESVSGLLKKVSISGLHPKILNSSLAYCFPLAILQDYEQIDVYGAEMANSSEYRSQQPIFAFWVGFCAGYGVSLNVNCSERLFVQPLYGIEDMQNNEKLHSFLNGLKEQKAEIDKQGYMVEGATQMIRQLLEE